MPAVGSGDWLGGFENLINYLPHNDGYAKYSGIASSQTFCNQS